jgi:protocatechuate 3,4-dioxygenase beta subunit
MTDAHDHEHDRGLDYDLPRIVERNQMGRRGLFAVAGGVGLVALAGCSDDSNSNGPKGSNGSNATSSEPVDASRVPVADAEIPEETAGPFPGDGTNGPDVLSESGVVRSDITTSFGSGAGVAEGVPTTVRLRIINLEDDNAAAFAGAAVYLWHCDREGRYSMYSDGVTGENYLRGVQEADAEGRLEFTTIFPACYSGRWPHMHFEVYESLDKATSADNKLRTSQLALPEDVCNDVYDNVEGYEDSVSTMSQLSLETDGIFSDGYSLQLAKVTGSVDEGYTVTLNVPV